MTEVQRICCKKSTDREVQMRHYINQQREIQRIEEIIEQQRRFRT